MWLGILATEAVLYVLVRKGGLLAGWLGVIGAFLTPCLAGLVMWWIEGHRVEGYVWQEFEGLCRSCGYELQGNTSGICQEVTGQRIAAAVPRTPADFGRLRRETSDA